MFRGRGSHRSKPNAAQRLALLALPASLATATVLWAGPSFAAGTYRTTTAVNVRSGPGTGSPLIGTEPGGATFSLLCQWQGSTNIGGNSTWDDVAFANGLTGAITDYDTTTPSWNSYAPGTGPCGANPAPPPSGGSLGGVNMQQACNAQGGGTAVATNVNSAYSWQCVGPGFSRGIDVTAECAAQYGYGAVAATSNPASAWSWHCHWNITAQMQAAISWSIAHASSQNWNYLCETEVENAYGTVGQFLTASLDYQWMYAYHHIHVGDRNAPRGALVFFNGDSSAGHVGLAAGDGANYYTTDGGTIHLAPLSEGGTVYYGWSFPPPTANWRASW
jgi:hypothetical protein